ncbi:D-lactate dehydrogenase [Propionispira arboris]|uniref:D-lactate dehydrogenase n=1 Tax=Propionispira arboris TaxID=84035 RepID=A0A1H7BDC8_9FIRM|nr:NAD(P)-dependent oxidoreductase [Propionispira arboris]SEJ75651.1 D-lactate dehydrogenase [Propionispira arboris]
MKIMVYDVLDYEKTVLKKLEQELEIEFCCSTENFLPENIALAAGCDAVSIMGYSRVDAQMLKTLKEMGIVHLSTRTVGFDNIDIKAAEKTGIHVSNARYMPANVADFTVMLMLMLLRKVKISVCRSLVNDFSLDGLKGREMRSLTIGIIGTGKIGFTVIQNISGFGCKIIAFDKYKNKAVEEYATYVELDELYAQSDIISLHMPLTDDNYHMINKDTIAKMKDGVLLVNTARGGLMDSEALIHALEKEKVSGAGLDTIEEEDGVMHVDIGAQILDKRSLLYLKQFPNVVFTQHYAFFTEEATESMVRCGILSLKYGLEGAENPYEVTRSN